MRPRIFGPMRDKRRFLLGAIASVGVLGILLISTALAVHDLGLFELDRNAEDPGGAMLPDDWATLYDGGSNTGGSSDVFTGILPDITTPDDPGDQFQGGGSKDDLDISQWLWKPGEPLDKDDITNAYAAAYTVPEGAVQPDDETDVGDLIIYFGLDRFDNNGSAQVGFWFFQNEIALTDTPRGGGFEFSGVHAPGDVLVQSNFSGGGDVDRVSVFAWDPTAPRNLRLITSTTAQDCESADADDPACAIVNRENTDSPWPYTPKSGPADVFAQGAFFEGGINITRLLPATGCISTFLAETRSSTPFDARLKDLNIGEFNLCGDKRGMKFHDRNADGDRDSGEEGLSGWTINLYNDTDGDKILDAGEAATPEETTTTAADDPATPGDEAGTYEFPDLQNGDYIVCEVLQSGWNQSLPNATDTPDELADCTTESGDNSLADNGYGFTMAGADQTGNDFGNFRQGVKSGLKYNDLNANGDRDAGEPGLADWVIRAYVDSNGDGDLDADETTVAGSDSTDANGEYSISLNPGRYVVCEVLQATWTQSEPAPAGNQCGNTVAGLGDGGYAILVTSGSTDPGNEFGNFRQGTKSGLKYNDLNANGDRDAGEPGLADWVIRAYVDSNGDGDLDADETTVAGSDSTDANGEYSISLNPGRYVVCEVLQATWTQSEPAPAGNQCGDTVAGLGDGGYPILVTSGSADPGNEFGNFRQGAKSGLKYNDLNANGDREAGEPGLADWVIRAYVDSNGDGDLDAGETTVAGSDTTDANGEYLISLNPGRYVVCEVLQATWTQSEPAPAGNQCGDTVAGLGDGGYAILVTSGSTDPDNEFGNFRQGAKSGLKYNDLNANGDREAGEPGLADWVIRAYVDSNGDGDLDAGETTVAGSDTTDANGEYLISLNPGRYVVCEVLQATWTQSEPAPAGNQCGDTVAGLGDGGYPILVTSGSTDPDNEFGNFQNATISGRKFKDADADSVKDPGEIGLQGWIIHLFGPGGTHAQTMTDATGAYSFTVTPGAYVVCEQTSGKPGCRCSRSPPRARTARCRWCCSRRWATSATT